MLVYPWFIESIEKHQVFIRSKFDLNTESNVVSVTYTRWICSLSITMLYCLNNCFKIRNSQMEQKLWYLFHKRSKCSAAFLFLSIFTVCFFVLICIYLKLFDKHNASLTDGIFQQFLNHVSLKYHQIPKCLLKFNEFIWTQMHKNYENATITSADFLLCYQNCIFTLIC